MRNSAFLLYLLFSVSQVYTQDSPAVALDNAIEKGMELFEIPAFALGIVHKGEIIYEKAYGYADAESKREADINTVFGVASCSKAFTAACIATLVDEGKLDWDDHVIEYLPEFRLHDPWITSELTIRDLLCHRAGYDTFDGDLLWYGSSYNREEVLERFGHRENEYSLRSVFGYSNIMYIAAGEVIREVAGMTWDQYVDARFFEPLGMMHTNTSNSDFTTEMNVALPHLDGEPMEFINYDNCGPAASINSTIPDLLEWVQLWLDKGMAHDERIFSAEQYYAMTSSITPMQGVRGEEPGGIHFYSYGLGWFLHDYAGRKVIQHGGGVPGFHSKVCFVPEDSLGFVILSNELSGLLEAMTWKVLDVFLKDTDADPVTEYFERFERIDAMKEETARQQDMARITGTAPSLEPAGFTGLYEDDMYGRAEVELQNDTLVLKLLPSEELFTARLEHWHYNTFSFRFNDPFLPRGFATFHISNSGKPAWFTIDLDNPDFLFYKLKFVKINND